jgi:pyridoxine kinase
VVTSTSFNQNKTGIAVFHNGNFIHIESTKYKVQSKVSGSGDITAAMFLCYIMKGLDIHTAVTKVTESLDGIFKTTSELNTPELALIQAQEFIK